MKDLFLTPRGDLSIENIIDSKERLEIKMDKNFEKLMKSVETFMKGLDEFREDFEKLVKEETGKTLEEIANMPTETDEQKEEFVNFSDLIQRIENEISMKDAFANSFSSLKQAFKQK